MRSVRVGAFLAVLVTGCSLPEQTADEQGVARVQQPLGSSIFPKMPASTGSVLVYDFTLLDGGNIDYLADDVATARALQGLVNRDAGPRVYIVASPQEAQWLAQIGSTPTVTREPPDGGTLLAQMFSVHKDAMQGRYLVYDLPPTAFADWSFPLALTQAGIEDGLPVTQGVYDRLRRVKDAGQEESFVTSRFASRLAAYGWAKQNQLPSAGTQAVFLLRQGTLRLYDYAVATRGFVFHLDWTDSQERDLATQILARDGGSSAIPLLGYYFDADGGTRGDTFAPMAAHSGLYGVAADFFGNASFWSKFPRAAGQPQRLGYAVLPRPGVVYASLFVSDGDNFQHNQNFIREWIGNPAAADLNAGVSINPGLIDFAPPLFSWSVADAGPSQELIGGPNGLGYSHPSIVAGAPETATYNRWLVDNASYMDTAGLVSAQLWKHEAVLWADGGETQEYLRRQPLITGVLNGDVDSAAGYQFNRPTHVYGTQVAANALGISVKADAGREFRTNMGQVLGQVQSDGGPAGGFFATQVIQQQDYERAPIPVAVDFAGDVVLLNQQNGGRMVPIAPRDWFASVRERYFAADQTTLDAGILLFSFTTASPAEGPFLLQNNSAVGPAGDRYADVTWSWTYELDIPDTAQSLTLALNLSGAHKITLSNVYGDTEVIESSTVSSRRWFYIPVPFVTSKLRVKFEDPTPNDGNGPSVSGLELRADPDSLVSSTRTDGGTAPLLVGGQSSGYGFDGDHIYADGFGYFTFGMPISNNRLNVAEIALRGQFVLEGATSSGGPYIVLASAHLGATAETIRVDLAPLASSNGTYPSSTVYLRFSDARPGSSGSDGNGPSVWSIRILAQDFRYAAFFDRSVFSPYPVGQSGPEEQALMRPEGVCNISATNGTVQSGIVVGGDAHRFADTNYAFTYRLYFPGTRSFGYASFDVGGEYVVSAAVPTDGGCPAASSWTILEQADGGTSGGSPRHRTSVDLSQFVTSTNREVYLRFTDGTPDGGNGASVSSLRAFSL